MWPDLPNTPERHRLYLISVETPVAPAYWIEVTVLSQQVGAHPVRLVRMRNVTAEKTSLRDMWSFHTMVMHKLNTPLHMMLASMELLTLSEPSVMSKEEIVELVEAASNGARRLDSAVTDVLQYASAPSMVARIGERLSVDELQDLASEVAEHLALESVSIKVEVEPSIQLPVAHRAMESILFELLENAKKFHPKNAPRVCIGVHSVDDDILIVVEDDGIHLSPEQLSRVWLPYYQAERYFTGEVPGMGLGLPIVASIVWESGGRCQIHNRKDEPGVVIELCFPRASEIL
ncbi:MAG: HAMP domain-containing histidine kinase [Caldilineaceae bacterium]|nr:HAMP domain-containing histidine kinase [Caldilineaceae bacterium]